MFSSLVAHGHRTLVICWFLIMVFAFSLPSHDSLFFRRRDKPLLLPDKMMRSRNLAPAVRGISGIRIPGNDGSGPNGRKERENLLSSRSIRSDETRQVGIRDLHDDPHAGEVPPISIPAAPEATHVRSWRNPHGVKLLRNDPRLIRLVAYYIIQVARDSPPHGERRRKNDDEMKPSEQLRLGPRNNSHSRQSPEHQHQRERRDVSKFDEHERVHGERR